MNCPHCQLWMTDAPELAGQLVACPGCHQRFVAPSVAPPPVAPAAQLPVAVATGPSTYRRAVARSFQPATSLVDFFDWEFKRYLTPWIIRATWIVVLVVAVLSLLGIGLNAVSDLATKDKQPPPGRSVELDWDRLSPGRAPAAESRELWVIVGAAVKAIGVLFFVLWFRVAAESVIVIFNIATILSEMREQRARVA